MDQRTYNLEYKEDGVFLIVAPFTGSTYTKIQEIIKYIDRKQVKDYDIDKVREAVEKKHQTEVKIADFQKENFIDEDLVVYVSDNEMKAYLEFSPPNGGATLTSDEIIKRLNEKDVIYGINTKLIEELSTNKEYNRKILVAEGTPPIEGEDAKLEFHINLYRKPKPELKKDGSVDYRRLGIIENVVKGDKLVSLTPAKQGVDGSTVKGKVLRAKPVKNRTLPKGKNTELSQDGFSLIASESGKVDLVNGKISVQTVYEVRGDVDLSVGDIDFHGDVIVYGTVRTGFTIKAEGSIEVSGAVEAAHLSAGKDVILKRGMQGLGKGTIYAEENVIARFIENGSVTAKGNIVAEAILHSEIKSGLEVTVGGKKGLIVGGSVSAVNNISAGTVGSPMATATTLQVGVDPFAKQQHAKLTAEITKLKAEEKKLTQANELLKRLERAERLSEDKILLKAKVEKRLAELMEIINHNEKELKKATVAISEAINGKIHVKKVIYPGTNLVIGRNTKKIRDALEFVTFKNGEEEIIYLRFEG